MPKAGKKKQSSFEQAQYFVKGTQNSQLSIMHSIWLRLIIALPVILAIMLGSLKWSEIRHSPKLYSAIAGGVIVQTVIGSYLWFYCTFKIGISPFQIIIATIPFFVYAADVYFFRRTKPSLYFLITALVALSDICLIIWDD